MVAIRLMHAIRHPRRRRPTPCVGPLPRLVVRYGRYLLVGSASTTQGIAPALLNVGQRSRQAKNRVTKNAIVFHTLGDNDWLPFLDGFVQLAKHVFLPLFRAPAALDAVVANPPPVVDAQVESVLDGALIRVSIHESHICAGYRTGVRLHSCLKCSCPQNMPGHHC